MKKDPLEISGMHNGADSKLFEFAARLRDTMTEPESMLWEFLKNKPDGFKFRRQHPIGRYILDFYCHKLRLSIEVDGGYHLDKEQQEKDKERTICINDLGIREIRFTNEEVLEDFEGTIEKMNVFLRDGSPFRAGEGAGNNSNV